MPGACADRAAASAGQSGLMALYDTLFAMMDLQVCSTFLPTAEPWLQKGSVQLQQCRTPCLLRKQVLDSVRGSKCYL